MYRYRIHQIKANLGEPIDIIPKKIAEKIRTIESSDILDWEIVKRAIDGRGSKDGTGVKIVYSVDFSCKKKTKLSASPDTTYKIPEIDAASCDASRSPVVVGFGPCGMFAALVLARAGLKPTVIERGSDVDSRIEKVRKFWEEGELDTECNVQFGEGGAGTFSDGKLNTGIKDPRARFVLETFVQAGADPNILIDGRPHIGTDDLRGIVKNIREEIISLGGEVRFDTKLQAIITDGSRSQIRGIEVLTRGGHTETLTKDGGAEVTTEDGRTEIIKTSHVVLAIGHSARDTVRDLYEAGIKMEPKAFSMGVRVEHPQTLIDLAMYGKDAGNPNLPAAYYKLSTKTSSGRGVYSFCMCPGGEIVNAASQEGGVVTNGMSNHDRDSGFANSGILVDVRPEDYGAAPDPLAGLSFQEKYERLAFVNGGGNYSLPTTRWGEFRDNDEDLVVKSLPDFVTEGIREAMPIFGKKIEGFDGDDVTIKGIESRSSSPVRILRDRESLEALKGLYPGGEGAGYAGGITSAACDGIKIAEKIIEALC